MQIQIHRAIALISVSWSRSWNCHVNQVKGSVRGIGKKYTNIKITILCALYNVLMLLEAHRSNSDFFFEDTLQLNNNRSSYITYLSQGTVFVTF